MADIKSLIDKFNIFRTKDSILNDVAKDNGQITIDIKQPFSDDIDSNNSLKTKLETNIKDKLFNTEINNVGSNIFDEKIKPFDKGYNVSNTPDTDTKTPIDTTPIKPDTPTIEKNTADATNIQQEKIQQPEITTQEPEPEPEATQQYKTIIIQKKPKLTTDSLGNYMPIDYDKRKGTSYSGVGEQQIDELFNLLKNDEKKFDMFMGSVYEALDQLKSKPLNDTENIIFLPFSFDQENGNMNGIRLTFGGRQKEWAEKQLKILAKGINDKKNEEWLSNLKLPEPETTMDKMRSNPWGKLLSFMTPPIDKMDPESASKLESGQQKNRLNAIKWRLIDKINECKKVFDKYYGDKSQVGTALSQGNIAETVYNILLPKMKLAEDAEIALILKKSKENPKGLTPIENEIVNYSKMLFRALSVIDSKTTTGYKTTKSILNSLPFMADFFRANFVGGAIRSGIRGGTRTAMKLGGKSAAKEFAADVSKNIVSRAGKFAGDIGKAAVQTTLSPLTHQNMLEDYSQTIATDGQYTKNDLIRGGIEAFTENFSERMFGALKGIMPKSNNAFVKSLFGNNPVIKSMQKHMNVGGLFEETAEEYAGDFIKTMFGFALNDEKLAKSFKEGLDNSATTILSIAITSGLPQAIGMGIDFREIRNTNKRFNVAEDNLKQYFNKENSYLDINRYSDALKSLYINLNNAKYEEDKAEIKGKIAELNKTAANLAMEKGDSNGFNLISEYSIAAQNSFYVTNKAMSELKNMSEEDRTKLSDNAINKLKNDFTNNLNWSLISRAAAKNITDQNGKQHPTCFLYTDDGVTYVLNGQKDNMFYFVDVNGNTISKSADELRNNENLSVLHLNNLLSSFSNKELEDINSKFIDIAQYNAGYRYKVNDNGEIRYYTDNKDLIKSNTPYEEINRDKIESNLVGSYDLVRIDNITNAVEDMAKAFAEPAAEQTSEQQTSEQQPAQEPAQETNEQPAEEPIQEQPQEQTTQEPAQEPAQEQTTEEQETTEQEPIQPTQQEIKPAQQEQQNAAEEDVNANNADKKHNDWYVTEEVTIKDGIRKTKYSKWRKSKSGEFKRVGLAGKPISLEEAKDIFDLEDIYLDDVINLEIIELREGKNGVSATIKVTYDNNQTVNFYVKVKEKRNDDSKALNGQSNTESQGEKLTTNELDKKSDISIQEKVQSEEVSAFDRVKNIIIATAQRKEPDTNTNGFLHLLRSLSDEELNEALEFVNTKKGRSKIDKINIGQLRSHIYYELEERDLSKNLEEAENRGYEYSLKSFENLPDDFDYAGYIINHELLAENYEKSGYKGNAAFQRGLIRAVKKLQMQAEEAKDVNTNPTEEQKKGTDEKEDNVLVGDTATSQRGEQGSTRDAATGERNENGNRTADSAGRGTDEVRTEQQVKSSYVEKQWSENDNVEEMKQRLEYLSKATEIGSKEENEIFPEYKQLEADKKALLEKYNGRVPKEKQDELAIKYKDFLDRLVKLFNEISSLRIAIEEAEEKTSIKAKEQAKQEKLNNIQNSYNGYLKGLSNLVASRLYKALSNKVNISGEVKTIAEFIEEWQKNGNLNVSTRNYKPQINRRRWNRMSGQEQSAWEASHDKLKTAYLVNDYELGKTAYDYANWLLSNKSTQQVQEDKTETKKEVKNKEVTTEPVERTADNSGSIEAESRVAQKEQENTKSQGKKPNETTKIEKIEDVGEKIGGSRKDAASEYKRRAEEDLAKPTSELEEFIANTPISKIFNFDLKKLREQGISNEVVSFIKIAKQSIPPKPRNAYKRKIWVSRVLAVYKMCLYANTKWDRIKETLEKDGGIIKDIYQAYMSVGGFDGGLELNGAALHQLGKEASVYKNGKRISLEGKWLLENAGFYDDVYDTKEEAIEYLKKFAGKNAVKPKSKLIEFTVYQRRADNTLFITPKGKSNIIIQDGFKSSKEAFDYIEEHQSEMEERYKTLMSDSNVEFGENRERKGRDYRGGKDISAQEFMETFGFRGVEFGNWTNQKDRQIAINNAYDAFMDLAEVLGVSPKALSLNGKLGMAFGARGRGKFNAHYERDKVVINLTKTKGAGSLAHEWFHALDHYFATLGKADSMEFATNLHLLPKGVYRYIDKQGNYKYHNSRGDELSEEEVIKAFEANGVRREMVEAWYYLMDKIRKSDYYKRSEKYSILHTNYWIDPTELGARAFSKWVENELSKRNATNDYLANNPALFADKVGEIGREYTPYPFDTDAEWIEDAFGNLFQTMEQKTDEETGNVILYQKSDGTIDVLSTEEAALRDALIDKLREAGIDVITDVEEAQRLLDEANGKGVSYFRTSDGNAYGFTVGGKIYIDQRIATADTPIHEYAHLWASAMQKLNPNEWANIVKLMKGTPIWEEVKRNYPELTTDNEIADEVLAFYSGSRGAERLREEHAKILKGNGNVVEKVKAINAIKRVREALKRFWKNVADWFGIHFTTAEEVADKVLSDLLNGVNPTLAGVDNDIRYRRASNRSVISSRFERQAEIQREEKNTKSAANIVLGNANVVLNDTNIFDEQYQNAIDNNLIDENVSPLIDSFGITWGYQLKNGVIVINKDVFVSDILDKRVKDNLSLLISSLMKTNKTFFKEGISFFKKLPIWVLYKNDTKSNEDTIKEIINDILLGNTSIDTNKLELLKQYTVQDMNDILDNATKWFEKFDGISSNMFAGNSISDILDTTLGDLMPKEITTTQEGKRLNWFSKLGIDIRSKLFDSLDWFRVVSDKTKDKTASELYDAMIVHTKRVQGKIDIFDKEYVRPIIDTIQSMLGKDFGNSTLSLDLIQEYFAIKSLLGRTASLYKERFGEYLANPDGKKPQMFDEFKQIYDEITEDEIKQRINEMGEKSSMSILQKVDEDYLMEEVRRTLAAEMFVKQYVYSSANTLNQGLQGEQSLGLINEVTNEPYSELYQLLYSDEQSSQTMHSPIEIIEQADILIDRAGLRKEFDFIGNQIQAILNYVNIERVENGLMSSDTFAKRQLMKDFVNQRGENSSEGNLYEITAKQKANEKMKGKDWFNPNSITSIIAVAQTEIATMEKELLAQRLSYFLTNPNNFDVLSQYGMIIDEKETLNEELSEDERNYITDKNIVLLYGERHTDKKTNGQVDKKKINILKRNDDGTFTKVTISFDNKFIGLEEFVKFVNNNFKYEELRGLSKAVTPITAWFSRMYTILSPLFPTKNLFKDLMVTPWLPAKELNGKNSQYAIKNFYNAFNNLSFILKMSFTEKSFSKKGFENKLKARSQELFEYYLEYSKQHSIFSIEDQIGALSKENKTLQDIERALSGKENKFIKFTERALLIKFMQHYAEVFENLHKFSAYVTLRKLGYGEERSAQIANNATLNYDRSGSIGRQLNAIIPFAKAALGGLYRTNYLLPKYNPKGFLQRVITLAVLGVMQGLMYDPDDDDISEFARKSGMVFGSFLYPLLPEELSIVRPVRALVIVMTGKKSPAYFKQELMESTIDLVPIASDALRGAFSYNPLTNKPEFDVGQLFANTDKMTAVYALAMLASYINENKNSFGKNVLLNEETNTDKTRYGRTKQDYGLYDYLARLYNSIINGVDIDDRAAMSNKIGKNGERLMTIAKEDVEFVINNYIPFGRLYAYTAEIIYDAVNDKRINKGHIPLIGGLFAQKSFGKDYYLVNNIKYELKDFTNDFSQSQIEDIKTNILVKADNRYGIRYKALKDNPNANPRMLDRAKRNMNEAFNVFILDINNFVNDNGDKKTDFTEDEHKFMLKSFLDSPIMKKALSIGEDTLNKNTAKRVEITYKRYKKYNNENIDTDKENMNEAAKNFKKMLYDKSITEEEFNNKLNSLYEPLFQQIKLRAKFAGYSIE